MVARLKGPSNVKSKISEMNRRPQNKTQCIIVTNSCNCNCEFCMVRTIPIEGLNFESIAERIRNAHGLKEGIELNGGEATLRKDFWEIMVYAHKLNVPVALVSNARIFSDKILANRALSLGLESVLLSVHGSKAEIHDSLTGTPGSFAETIEGLKNLIELDANLLVNTVVAKQNYSDLTEISKLLAKLGIRNKRFSGLLIRDSRARQCSVPLALVRPHLSRAVRLLLDKGIEVTIEKLPICALPQHPELFKYEKWLVESKETVKPAKCKLCIWSESCVGITQAHHEIYGDGELVPITKR